MNDHARSVTAEGAPGPGLHPAPAAPRDAVADADANAGVGAERRPEPLRFSSDVGAGRSKWIALALVLLIIGWMGSGFVMPADPADAPAPARSEGPAPVAVAVMPSTARPVARVFVAEGQALPDRDSAILAESTGQIAEVAVQRGQEVRAGEVVARLDPTRAEADLVRAREALTRAQRELGNAEALLDRGVATADRVATARADLAAAEAGLAAAEEALGDMVLRAPFDGRIERLDVNAGEYVTAGREVARIVDTRPLSIEIQIPQQALEGISVGQAAQVRFITGIEAEGVVRFVGSSADAETRTFAAEIEVANADGAIPAGISARVSIVTGEIVAHFVSPAILSLGPEGALGIKTVEEGDRVAFYPVGIERAQTDGIWISGLPEAARIITVGQGFVNAGETVAPHPAPQLETGAAPAEAPAAGSPATGAPATQAPAAGAAGADAQASDAPAPDASAADAPATEAPAADDAADATAPAPAADDVPAAPPGPEDRPRLRPAAPAGAGVGR